MKYLFFRFISFRVCHKIYINGLKTVQGIENTCLLAYKVSVQISFSEIERSELDTLSTIIVENTHLLRMYKWSLVIKKQGTHGMKIWS